MTPDSTKRLRMFAGPNGSGKTSLVQTLAKEFSDEGLFLLHHFVSADDILLDLQLGKGISLECIGNIHSLEQIRKALLNADRLPKDHPFFREARIENSKLMVPSPGSDGYVGAAIADFLRDELFGLGRSFSFETVMSHPSKIAFFAEARKAGYRTYLYFIATESSRVSTGRVKQRAALGGHDVPEQKIAERYKRCLELVGKALPHAYRAFLFDNSGSRVIWLAELLPEGTLQLKVAAESLPDWFRNWVVPHCATMSST